MLESLKLLLGIESDDTSMDSLLSLLISMAGNRLLLMINTDELPEALEPVVIDVALARFNRIGSEGLTSHTVEGESQNFTEDDFSAYTNDIQAYMASQEGGTVGKVRFL